MKGKKIAAWIAVGTVLNRIVANSVLAVGARRAGIALRILAIRVYNFL